MNEKGETFNKKIKITENNIEILILSNIPYIIAFFSILNKKSP